MDAKKLKAIRQRLSSAYEDLIQSINRNRSAAQEISLEKTEDEGDLATISHTRDLLYNLDEGGFARLRFIQEAIKALDRGKYGECSRCGKGINEKRLEALPWAALCMPCQQNTEAEDIASRTLLAGTGSEDAES